ncbi:MAG: hypothetical protein CXR31_00550 [Geobacter sp.]|nr:MAG: hypothetical protein CXR31_00550 [Geobacter sp.]
MKRLIVILWGIAVLAGCGGGGGGGGSSTPPVLPAPAQAKFWAADLSTSTASYYQVTANKVAEGAHCYIYLEQGQTVSSANIDKIQNEFDTTIYPDVTTAFGSEPNPGIDNDPKIYILLLSIKDGFNYPANPSYIAGFFDPLNEYSTAQHANSNQKEMFYMNVNPAVATWFAPASIDFFRTLAHEFQHMIHWEQKDHLRNLHDDTWLDEGMGMVSPAYCGYGADYDAVNTFEHASSDSLTVWKDSFEDYGVVYMWAQYYKDRVGNDIFHRMLQNNLVGIASVNNALATAGYPKDFTGTFRDWAVANYYGDGTTVPVPAGHPEWSYVSINTWPGAISLPGLFPVSRQNVTTLQPLDQWSLGFYSYTPVSPPAGSITWTPTATATEKGAFVDGGGSVLTYDMLSGTTYNYTSTGYLILQNPAGTATTSGDTVVRANMTPVQVLEAANTSPEVRARVAASGKPQRIDIGPSMRGREKGMRAQGLRPQF